MNISLPEPIEKWVEEQVAKRGYGTADAFFLELVQREKALEARDRIDDLLTDAIEEGQSTPMTRKDWDRIKANGLNLARERRKK